MSKKHKQFYHFDVEMLLVQHHKAIIIKIIPER
ncbi:MAG: hypothetical protein ACI9VO_001353, partial [Colwellia sp.]